MLMEAEWPLNFCQDKVIMTGLFQDPKRKTWNAFGIHNIYLKFIIQTVQYPKAIVVLWINV